MKKIFTILIAVLSITCVSAQEDFEEENENKEMETLFNRRMSFGGYGGPELKFTTVNEKYGLMVGGHGGFILNHNFVVGFGGYGLTTNSRFSDDTLNIATGYGGMRLEYICCSHKIIHFSIPVLIGAGGVGIMEERAATDDLNVNIDYDDDEGTDWNTVESSAYFVVEPGVNVEFNIVKHFRMTMGASYRYVGGTDLSYLSDTDLSDVSFNLGFKFGVF